MTFQGRDIFRCALPDGDVGFSRVFETILAARWRGYKDEEFEELPPESQARIIAAYRVATRLESVLAHDRAQKMNKGQGSTPGRRWGRRRR